MTTIRTLFSGGEGVGVGARNAGLDHLWGIEFDDAISSVGRLNGFNTLTGDVCDADLMCSLPRPDVIHASPVCKNASNAKANGEESPLDIETADATCAYITHFKPDIFTLENVYGYRTFMAFTHIIECLNRNHYRVDYWHLNAADYGVPQTSQRLILVAQLNRKPRRPVATHAEPSKIAPLFDDRLPWVGWYKAIYDLIDTLEPFEVSKRVEKNCVNPPNPSLINSKDTYADEGAIMLERNMPCFTIQAAHGTTSIIVYQSGMFHKTNINIFKRLGSFPEWYRFNCGSGLSTTIIGNAVPPLLYQRVIEAQL